MERDEERRRAPPHHEPHREVEEPRQRPDSARALLASLATVRRIARAPSDFLVMEEGPEGTLDADDILSPTQKEEMRKAEVEARLYVHEILIQDQAKMLAAVEGFRGYALGKRNEVESTSLISSLIGAVDFVVGSFSSYCPLLKPLATAGKLGKIFFADIGRKFDVDTAAQTMVMSFTAAWANAVGGALRLPREMQDISHQAWLSAPEGKREEAVRIELASAGIVSGNFEMMRHDMQHELTRQIDVWKCRTGGTADLVGCATDKRLDPPRRPSPSDLAYGPGVLK